jgi:hypothetical protein
MGDSAPVLFSNDDVLPFTVALESGLAGSTKENESTRPLLPLLLPLVIMSALSFRLLSNVLDVFAAAVATTGL